MSQNRRNTDTVTLAEWLSDDGSKPTWLELAQELDETRQLYADALRNYEDVFAKVTKMEQERGEIYERLNNHGTHRDNCAVYFAWTITEHTCNCGLDAMLRSYYGPNHPSR